MGLGKFFDIVYLSPPNPNSFLSFLALHAGDAQNRGQENKLRAQRHLAAVLLGREGCFFYKGKNYQSDVETGWKVENRSQRCKAEDDPKEQMGFGQLAWKLEKITTGQGRSGHYTWWTDLEQTVWTGK